MLINMKREINPKLRRVFSQWKALTLSVASLRARGTNEQIVLGYVDKLKELRGQLDELLK